MPERTSPVAPARRSGHAQAKASGEHGQTGQPYRSFGGLLDHLATLTRNQVRFPGTSTSTSTPMLTEPAPRLRADSEPHRRP